MLIEKRRNRKKQKLDGRLDKMWNWLGVQSEDSEMTMGLKA